MAWAADRSCSFAFWVNKDTLPFVVLVGRKLGMAVILGQEARGRLLEGVDRLADAVRVTLGPAGRNVSMANKAAIRDSDYSDKAAPDAPVLVTNDGVTIARSIVLDDPVQNMGAQLVKEAAIKANEVAGDGTTTAIVLVQAILREAYRQVAAGADPLALRRGAVKAGDAMLAALREAAVSVDTQEDLARIATISCQDETLGELVGEALFRVGLEGVVNVDDSRRMDTTLDVTEGAVFDRGLISPYMATDSTGMIADLEDPYILLTDKKLSSQQDLIPALICAAEDGRDALVICDGIEGEALTLVLENKRHGDMNVACVLAPEYGEGRRWRMDDLAVQTGGLYITDEAGLSLRDVTRDMLGEAECVHVDGRRTTIMGGKGDPDVIKARVDQLRYYAENTEYDFNRKRHAERLAKFVSGVATIKVGGVTDAEQRERKMRVDDAVHAARAAFEEGMVAGGGVALFDAAGAARDCAEGLSGDEALGARIVADACAAPMRQIAENAGKGGAAVLARVAEMADGTGYDAAHDRYVNMLEEGIADPLRVTRSALEAALSVAGTVLLTEANVTNDKAHGLTVAESLGKGARYDR